MKYKFMILLLVLFLFSNCAKNIQNSPRSTIEAFIKNVEKLNEKSPTTIQQAEKILKKLFSTEKAYEAFTTTFRNIKIEEYTTEEAEMENSNATVLVKMKTKGLIGTKEEIKQYNFNLEKKNAKWFIKDIAGILQEC